MSSKSFPSLANKPIKAPSTPRCMRIFVAVFVVGLLVVASGAVAQEPEPEPEPEPGPEDPGGADDCPWFQSGVDPWTFPYVWVDIRPECL